MMSTSTMSLLRTVHPLQRLSKTVLQRQLNALGLSPRRCRSSQQDNSKVLGHSTLLLQDGLEIQELPLVIRRMTVGEFPFTSIRYTGEESANFTEEESFFNEQLKACSSIKQVFSLLEVPGDAVTTQSASMALQRLCQLQSASRSSMSFVRKAIFNELCDTATTDSHILSNKAVVALVLCYLNSNDYNQAYVRRINDELERRVGDGVFSIPELAFLIKVLSENPKGDSDVITNIWMHLGMRFPDINEKNIGNVFENVQYMSPKHYYVIKVLDKQINKFWWKLSKEDVSVILKNHRLTNRFNAGLMKVLSDWLFLNINQVSKNPHKMLFLYV